MIPINYKITNFPYTSFLLFWKHNNYGWLILFHTHAASRQVPQWSIIEKPISQYASYTAVFCPLHSNIHTRKIWKIYSWNTCLISQYMKAIMLWFQQCRTYVFHNTIRCGMYLCDLYVLQWSHYTPTQNYHIYAVVKKKWGTKGFKRSIIMPAL